MMNKKKTIEVGLRQLCYSGNSNVHADAYRGKLCNASEQSIGFSLERHRLSSAC